MAPVAVAAPCPSFISPAGQEIVSRPPEKIFLPLQAQGLSFPVPVLRFASSSTLAP